MISSTPMPTSRIDRRRFLAGAGALALSVALPVALIPRMAEAMTQAQARALIDQVMRDVHQIINSGRAEAQMFGDFERLFQRYGDIPVIARSALGPPARSASAAQMNAFTEAFRGYMARKYGRQFRSFIGATVEVTGARPVQRYWEVISVMSMRGEPPFELRWHVSDRSGARRFFNLIIEGVNLLAAERQEIGTMLERRGGDLDRLIADLRRAG